MTYEEIKEKREALAKAAIELQNDIRKAAKSITGEKEHKVLVKTYEMCSKCLDVYVDIWD